MTAVDSRPAIASWNEPANVAARGTLILIPGRGEHPALYERFGRRISADAWRVRVVGDAVADEAETRRQVETVLADIAANTAAEAVSAHAAGSAVPPGPVVLVGSDAGALYATILAADGDIAVDALILAGAAPTGPGVTDEPVTETAWDDEVQLRTACSAHQSRLRNDGDVRRGAIFAPVPATWSQRARLDAVTVPVLALHGLADEITPFDAAERFYGAAPALESYGVQGGRHDVLNDQTHRSVAATVVLFLERLRLQFTTDSETALSRPPEIVTRLAPA